MPMPPTFGDTHPSRATTVALALATFILLAITAGLLASGGPAPLLVILPIYAAFVLWLSCRRRVVLDPAARDILITRTLFGRAITCRIPFAAITAIESRGLWLRPRGGRPDQGTPEGDAHFIKYDLALRRGRRRLLLDRLNDPPRAEALARDIAALIGVPAWRHDYTLRADGLPLWQLGAREPIG